MDCAVNGGACQLAGRAVGVCEVNGSAYVNGSVGGHMSMGRHMSMGQGVGICRWAYGVCWEPAVALTLSVALCPC